MWHWFLLLYWVNWLHCHYMYGQQFLLNFDEMECFTYLVYIRSFIIDTNTWLFICYFFKFTSVLNGVSFWTLLWENFEVPITLSLFDVFKLFGLLLLTCELTVLDLLLLEIYVTFLPCFLLDDVNTISIYFTFVKWCLSTVNIKL